MTSFSPMTLFRSQPIDNLKQLLKSDVIPVISSRTSLYNIIVVSINFNNESTSLYNIIIVSINFNNERTSLYNIIVVIINFPKK